MMNVNEPTPTDAARTWHVDELAPRPRKEPPMSRMTVRIPASKGVVYAPDAFDDADLGPATANGVRIGQITRATVVDDGHAVEYEITLDSDAATAEAILNRPGQPRSLTLGDTPPVIAVVPPGGLGPHGVSLVDIYGDSPGVRAASDRMASTRIPLDSDTDDGEPD